MAVCSILPGVEACLPVVVSLVTCRHCLCCFEALQLAVGSSQLAQPLSRVGADFFQIPTNPTRMHLGFKWPKTSFPAPHTRHRRNLILLVACTIHTTVSSEMINASIYLTLNWRARVANLHSFYCSRECQTIHWKKKKGGHKLACEHMKQACEDAASRLVNVISDGNHRPLDGCG